MTAFFGEARLKDAVMLRLEQHRRLDDFVQKIYYESGKGCHLGCLTHCNDESQVAAERLFGIPIRVAYWLEAVFEGLPADRCGWWAVEGTRAIPVGADLSLAHHRLCAWILGPSNLLAVVRCNREAIETCRALHDRAAAGETVTAEQWSAAMSAAWSAESAAWSAASAAWSAARSAAWSAASAARSAAEWAAASAGSAESAAWEKIAAQSIEIFRTSPVVGKSDECERCVAATMAHLNSHALVGV